MDQLDEKCKNLLKNVTAHMIQDRIKKFIEQGCFGEVEKPYAVHDHVFDKNSWKNGDSNSLLSVREHLELELNYLKGLLKEKAEEFWDKLIKELENSKVPEAKLKLERIQRELSKEKQAEYFYSKRRKSLDKELANLEKEKLTRRSVERQKKTNLYKSKRRDSLKNELTSLGENQYVQTRRKEFKLPTRNNYLRPIDFNEEIPQVHNVETKWEESEEEFPRELLYNYENYVLSEDEKKTENSEPYNRRDRGHKKSRKSRKKNKKLKTPRKKSLHYLS
jgi:hypothetical protein